MMPVATHRATTKPDDNSSQTKSNNKRKTTVATQKAKTKHADKSSHTKCKKTT
jgi:hypothetical protein